MSSSNEPSRPELSVVMPCLNEAETIASCIRKAQGAIEALDLSAEIVVGDNGSTDGSIEIAKQLGARVVSVPVRGYGAALQHACRASKGRFIIMADSDDSYDFSNLAPFVEKLRAGYDLVMGNRFAGGIKPGAMPFKNRYIGNPVLSMLGRFLFKTGVGDFHCGMRGFTRSAFDCMNLRSSGMEFASEMVVKASLLKLKVTEVPIVLHKDGRSRRPHLRPWRDGWRHLRFLLLFSPRWLFVYPGIILSSVGLFLLIWLYPQPRLVGSIRLDIHTMLFGAGFLLVGIQALTLGVFARIVAVSLDLIPGRSRYDRMLESIRFECLLILGVALLAAGLYGSFSAVSTWAHLAFGNLDGSYTLRLAVMSVSLIILGVQMMLNAFYFGLLEYRDLLVDEGSDVVTKINSEAA